MVLCQVFPTNTHSMPCLFVMCVCLQSMSNLINILDLLLWAAHLTKQCLLISVGGWLTDSLRHWLAFPLVQREDCVVPDDFLSHPSPPLLTPPGPTTNRNTKHPRHQSRHFSQPSPARHSLNSTRPVPGACRSCLRKFPYELIHQDTDDAGDSTQPPNHSCLNQFAWRTWRQTTCFLRCWMNGVVTHLLRRGVLPRWVPFIWVPGYPDLGVQMPPVTLTFWMGRIAQNLQSRPEAMASVWLLSCLRNGKATLVLPSVNLLVLIITNRHIWKNPRTEYPSFVHNSMIQVRTHNQEWKSLKIQPACRDHRGKVLSMAIRTRLRTAPHCLPYTS